MAAMAAAAATAAGSKVHACGGSVETFHRMAAGPDHIRVTTVKDDASV
jgi:hypothetical protein